MNKSLLLSGSLLAIAAVPAAAQPIVDRYEARPLEQVDQVTQAEEVRIRTDAYERMTVPIRVSGVGPYRFLVDTGADRTAISRSLASRLGLSSGPTARLHSITGESRVGTAEVPHLQMNGRIVRDVRAALLEEKHMGADGILGVDSLRSNRVLLDFEAGTMSIVPSAKTVNPREEGTIVVTGRLRNGRLVLTNAEADRIRIDVIVDTGSQATIGNTALRRKLAKRGLLKTRGMVELESVTGEKIVGEVAIVERLKIGGVKLEDIAIVFFDAHTFEELKLNSEPALLLGMNALRAFDRVSIDFASKKFRVMLPEVGSNTIEFKLASL